MSGGAAAARAPAWLLAIAFACGGSPAQADERSHVPPAVDQLLAERTFRDAMTSYSAGDYRRAEALFRRILERNPRLVRVRLELARALYMQRSDEEADYHFSLAAAERPLPQVARNITRFREAIRARRALRASLEFGFAPDSNINSATGKQTVDIQGLAFQLDPSARRKSGTGRFVGGEASVRLDRLGPVPIHLVAHGRWTQYGRHGFDDAYAAIEAGPEFRVAGGRLRAAATGLRRWYGGQPLVTSLGAHLDYERLAGDRWALGASLSVRRNDYARRSDFDGWDAEARLSARRPLGRTALGFAWAGAQRGRTNDPGQAYWKAAAGIGLLKEIRWGLRPQVSVDIARQVNDGPLAPFGHRRRDWLLRSSISIYKRDWNVGGLAPSLSVSVTRNASTIPLYDERRRRAEVRLTKAF